MIRFNKYLKIIFCLCVALLIVTGCGAKKEKGIKLVNLVKDDELIITELYITDKKELSSKNLVKAKLNYNDDVKVKLSSLFKLEENKKINITIVDDKGKSYIWYDIEVNDGNALEMRMKDGMVHVYVVESKKNTIPYNPNTIVLP